MWLAVPRVIGPVAILDPAPAESNIPYEDAEFAPFPKNWTLLCGDRSSLELDMQLEEAAQEFDVEPALLATVIIRESGCRPEVMGLQGEIGLGQINPFVWKNTLRREGLIEYTGQLYNAEINLRCSSYILSRMLKRSKGDTWGALRRYNGSGKRARAYADEAYRVYASLKLESGVE
jgi:soluble lytic murein transglycosylase-like protein